MGREEESITQELMISDLMIPSKSSQKPTKPRNALQQVEFQFKQKETPYECGCCCFTVRVICEIVCFLSTIVVVVAVYVAKDSISDY